MFLTTTQRRILAVTGLLGLGFVFGLAIQSPSVHRAMLGTSADQAPEIRTAGLPTSHQENGTNQTREFNCAEPGSAPCRPVMESYLRYLEKRQDATPDGEFFDQADDQGEAHMDSEQRIVTVYHGSRATQYVVGREPD